MSHNQLIKDINRNNINNNNNDIASYRESTIANRSLAIYDEQTAQQCHA